MRQALFTLLFFSLAIKGWAECITTWLSVYPETSTIGFSPLIVFEGSGDSQRTVESLSNQSLCLESEQGDLIPLKVVSFYLGWKNRSQIALQPERPLVPNTSYTLLYDDPVAERYNGVIRDLLFPTQDDLCWTTREASIIATPIKSSKISFERINFMELGCGLDHNAIFKLHDLAEQQTWYKAELVDLKTNKSTAYLLQPKNRFLYVGYSMCGGSFNLQDDRMYSVQFSPMAGAEAVLQPTPWITFYVPKL